MYLEKYNTSDYWAVREDNGDLICVTVYKKGSIELIKKLEIARDETSHKSLEKYNIDVLIKTLKNIKKEINDLDKYLKKIQL